ncbi:MAG: DUF3365 domain-containing protein [Desulfurivibrionaceae bacterium]|nr:DUF3365 domain-containing protein [Desulfobulbales bacterium]MDT8335545.1 DUF3365 domain-containing protein [Desulfurivibrionaceae bacterium]
MDSPFRTRLISRVFLSLAIAWTVLMIALALLNTREIKKRNTAGLVSQARSFYQLIVTARLWNAVHGGVYVPITETTRPNPYLNVPEREIVEESGRVLTLINPAYMTRQLSELTRQASGVKFNLTSLRPLRPENAPSKWEAEMLRGFARDNSEKYSWVADEESGESYFRYMSALWTTKECLGCHADQGYKEGDLRGGISVSIATERFLDRQGSDILFVWLSHFLIWFGGLIGAGVSYKLIKTGVDERENLIEQLYRSLNEIKTLRGLLPICATCKKIRNDQGAWEVIEKYIKEHSEAEFSHGICPDCVRKFYPEHADKILGK